MKPTQDRRFEARSPSNVRGVLVAPGFEMTCLITDQSASGLKVWLDRALSLPRAVVVVDIARGVAIEADIAWAKGQEAGLKRRNEASLKGLVPARLAQARDAWLRAGGR